MHQVNRIIFAQRDFKDLDTLYKKVGEQMRLLLESGNIVIGFDADDKGGVIVLEYVHDDDMSPKPYWLNSDEYEVAKDFHDECEIEGYKRALGLSKMANDDHKA